MDRSLRRILTSFAATVVAVLVAAPFAAASQDPYSERQWALDRVRAEKAWSIGGKGKGVTIAIVDSGVDLAHEDLKGAFVDGRDFVDDDADASDEHGHGTHVAGIAAARANNGVGVAGVAPEAKIMPVRVLNDEGSGTGADVDAGIRWAADHGADVINLSLSDGDVVIESLFGDSLNASLDYAWSKGAVPVVVSGNDGFFRTQLASANALMVTATGPDDTKPGYANSVGFAKWAIAAPGGTSESQRSMVFSTLWTASGKTNYGWAYGTSMAAPHVAGAAAILRGLGLSPQQTVDRLLSTARDIGNAGRDNTYGSGLLDVAAAASGIRRLPGTKAAGTAAPSSPSTAPSPERRADEASSTVTPGAAEAEPSSGADATVSLPAASDRASPSAPLRAVDDVPSRRPPMLVALALASVLAAAGCTAALALRLRR